jgi:hypothetical protein
MVEKYYAKSGRMVSLRPMTEGEGVATGTEDRDTSI